jgi:hypothetical protein
MSKYAKAPATTNSFPKYNTGPEVDNASGAPSTYTQTTGRRDGGPTIPDLGGENKSNRSQNEINGETGQAVADSVDQALTRAARHLSFTLAVEGQDSNIRRGYLDHVFGLNLRRDRA